MLGFFTGLLMGWSEAPTTGSICSFQTIGSSAASGLPAGAAAASETTYTSAAFIVGFRRLVPHEPRPARGFAYVRRVSTWPALEPAGSSLSDSGRASALRTCSPACIHRPGTSLAALMTADCRRRQGPGLVHQAGSRLGGLPRMYVGLIILVTFYRTLMVLLFKIRSSLLAWQQNLVVVNRCLLIRRQLPPQVSTPSVPARGTGQSRWCLPQLPVVP